MKIILNNIKLPLNDDIGSLKYLTAKKLKIKAGEIIELRIIKESIDARKKNDINLIYSIMAEVENNFKFKADADIKELVQEKDEELIPGSLELPFRPLIVGNGPAGLFAALILSQNGYKPLVIERGDSVEKRNEAVIRYWNTGELDTESNVQFGEGGAGTFSDGKLTTRINDSRCEKVFDEFQKSGILKEVLYKAKPHIGTDKLKQAVVNMRKRIIENGGEIRFRSKLTSLIIKDGRITGAVVNQKEIIDTNVLVLAIGHSARDTFEALHSSGVTLIQKPFSVGLRIEHPQDLIDRAQYGKSAGNPKLGAADYHLFYKTGERTVYTFCMCPGGVVTASASENGMIVTNGMSEFARDKENANSAWVVSVDTGDFGSSHPLAGVEFQRGLERNAFKAGGSDSSAPVQRLQDFITCTDSGLLGKVKPGYTGKTRVADLNPCLPDFIKNPMKESIKYFDNKLKVFGMLDAVLTGVETRTSSPVRILRDELFQATGIRGLYPAGEGAGYAGGIVSAAVDGIRVAEEVIRKYKPLM